MLLHLCKRLLCGQQRARELGDAALRALEVRQRCVALASRRLHQGIHRVDLLDVAPLLGHEALDKAVIVRSERVCLGALLVERRPRPLQLAFERVQYGLTLLERVFDEGELGCGGASERGGAIALRRRRPRLLAQPLIVFAEGEALTNAVCLRFIVRGHRVLQFKDLGLQFRQLGCYCRRCIRRRRCAGGRGGGKCLTRRSQLALKLCVLQPELHGLVSERLIGRDKASQGLYICRIEGSSVSRYKSLPGRRRAGRH